MTSQDTPGYSPMEDLTRHILESRFEQIDEPSIANAKNRLIDVAGCVAAGAAAPGNLPLINLIKDFGGKEEATILIHGVRVPAHNAAMANCIMARSNDAEPVDVMIGDSILPAHTSGTTVMTALTLGEVQGITGRELITALLVGDDVAARILASSRSPGWDTTGTVNTFGATAIAARLLGLNRDQARNAFGLALNQMGGSFQSTSDTTTAFKLQQGTSARNGIFSAQLAKAGWTGPSDALQGEFGYYNLYTAGDQDLGILTEDLGKKYFSDVTFKPYPCCRITHAAISCALALVRKHDFRIEDIRQILIHGPRKAIDTMCGQPFSIERFSHARAVYSYYFTVATALLRKNVALDHFSEEAMRDPGIAALIGKMRLAELPGSDFLSSRVTLILNDGKEFSEYTDAPKGHPILNPMSKDEIVDKFFSNTAFSRVIPREKAERLLHLLDSLEELDNVRTLVDLLAG